MRFENCFMMLMAVDAAFLRAAVLVGAWVSGEGPVISSGSVSPTTLVGTTG